MFTREEAIKKLEGIEREIADLKKAIQVEWDGASEQERTKAFLDKCGGWEDAREPDEIIADIYAARTSSDRGADLFGRNAE